MSGVLRVARWPCETTRERHQYGLKSGTAATHSRRGRVRSPSRAGCRGSSPVGSSSGRRAGRSHTTSGSRDARAADGAPSCARSCRWSRVPGAGVFRSQHLCSVRCRRRWLRRRQTSRRLQARGGERSSSCRFSMQSCSINKALCWNVPEERALVIRPSARCRGGKFARRQMARKERCDRRRRRRALRNGLPCSTLPALPTREKRGRGDGDRRSNFQFSSCER